MLSRVDANRLSSHVNDDVWAPAMETQAKLQIVEKNLDESLPVLKSLGYAYAGRNSIKTTWDAYEIVLSRPAKDIEVSLSICCIEPTDKIGDWLDFYIDNRIRRDRFSLSGYFKYRNRIEQLITLRCQRVVGEGFESWLAEKLFLVNAEFSTNLYNFISGQYWERIPMDWMGYK